ncbi:MAG: hypothetical protein V4662_02580 [Verrucomicrobiota bacterium]
MRLHRLLFLTLATVASAADPAGLLTYFDETTMRHLALQKADFDKTNITIRFACDPGSMSTWVGDGVRKDKLLPFARIVGEGEDRGTSFTAEISESKVVVGFREGQKQPQDAGINGTYRRASEAKLLQLYKKEFQASNDRLVSSLKNATKSWAPADRPALLVWKDQWTALRQRWLDLSLPKAAEPPKTDTRFAPAKPAEPTADYWLKMAQATARAYYFVETMPDPKTGSGWDGEYDDLGGGHASLRLGKDGKLRVSLSSARKEGQDASTVDGTAPPEKVVTAKNGEMTAEFSFSDGEATVKNKPATFKLTKIGRYLKIESQDATPYVGNGWYDGVYRGSPVPQG